MNMNDELARLLLLHGENANRFFTLFTSKDTLFEESVNFTSEIWFDNDGRKIKHDIEFMIHAEHYDSLMDVYEFVRVYYPDIKIRMLIESSNKSYGTVHIQKEIDNV